MRDLLKCGLCDIEKLKVWREGKAFSEIGLTVDRHVDSIFGVLKLNREYLLCNESV